MKEITSVEYLVETASRLGAPISEIVLENQVLKTKSNKQDILLKMEQNLKAMEESVANGLNRKQRSISGLSGGAAAMLSNAKELPLVQGGPHVQKDSLCGELLTRAMAKALAAAETNACMGRIVAAPTAGSCGILPGVLFAIAEGFKIERSKLLLALFNAGGIGMVIAKNASISGADGGCQAECGSASAMAASAAVELMGGTPRMCAHACALALKFAMGLICDPVAGLVEVPCVKRNASGAANAFVAAQMALAGIESAIPADEVIAAMKSVGAQMNQVFKETSLGGIAISSAAQKIEKNFRKR